MFLVKLALKLNTQFEEGGGTCPRVSLFTNLELFHALSAVYAVNVSSFFPPFFYSSCSEQYAKSRIHGLRMFHILHLSK